MIDTTTAANNYSIRIEMVSKIAYNIYLLDGAIMQYLQRFSQNNLKFLIFYWQEILQECFTQYLRTFIHYFSCKDYQTNDNV